MNFDLPYEPLEKQSIFHSSLKKFRVYAGGMGCAKTKCGVAETLKQAMAFPKNFILVGRATYPELRDSTRREFLEMEVVVDGKDYALVNSPLVRSWNKAENNLILVNGTEIAFRALEDSFDKIKSMNLGGFWVDELTEIPREMWLALVGRLRRKGVWHFGLGTTNPEGHDWVWKEFIASSEKTREWPNKTFVAEGPETLIVTATSHENPYLPEGYVQSMAAMYPEEWVDRYINGSFDTFGGLIYHEFQDKEPFVVKPFEIPDEWYKFIALDHGYRNPTAILWFAVDPKGVAYVYDEYYERQMLVSDLAVVIKTKNKRQNVKAYLIDPSCKIHRGTEGGLSVVEEFSKYGVYFDPANNDIRAGINRVKERMKDGKGLKIFSSCKNLRTELQMYKWKDLKQGAIQDAPEKPVKKDDHLSDALRYGVAYMYDTPQLKPKETGWKWRDYLGIGTEQVDEHWMAA